MKKVIVLGIALAMLSGCATIDHARNSPNTAAYADTIFRVAQAVGQGAVNTGKMSRYDYAVWERRMELLVAAFKSGTATKEEFDAVAKEVSY